LRLSLRLNPSLGSNLSVLQQIANPDIEIKKLTTNGRMQGPLVSSKPRHPHPPIQHRISLELA